MTTRTPSPAYDMADEYSFADYLATFDGQWNLIRNIFINDDGTNSVINYDVQNEHSWAWVVFDYDSNWNLLAQHGQNDDGSSFGNSYLGDGGQGSAVVGLGAADEMPAWIGAADDVDPLENTLPAAGSNAAGAEQGSADENSHALAADDLPIWVGAVDEARPATVSESGSGYGNGHDLGPNELPVWVGAVDEVRPGADEYLPKSTLPSLGSFDWLMA